MCRLLLKKWHRVYRVQVKCFSLLLNLKTFLENQGLCHLLVRLPNFLRYASTFRIVVMIQAGVILSYSIYWTQCGHRCRSRATSSTSIEANTKTHVSHINNQAQKNSLTKKEKKQSIQNVSVKCFKEHSLYESMGRAVARPQHVALPSCIHVKLYSPLNP